MPDFAALRRTVSVADGSWSVQLQARGLPANIMAETANLSHPELVVELARDYVAAGARFITTNTFAANRFTIERRGLKQTVAEINQAGVELARAAVGASAALVVGSIGPSGKILAVDEASPDQLAAAFEEQAAALARGGVDAIVLETFSELAEVLLAVRVVKETTGLPVIASMSFDSGPQRTRTMMGAAADECAAALEDADVDAIGYNCGSGIEHALPAVVALRAGTGCPLWIKPNAGLPELEGGRVVYRQTPEEFAAFVPTLIDAGANIIGGCCGTTPEHIRRVAVLVASYERRTGKSAE
ncbi:MAG: homocysteine S-methyltransferase family protein [Planctomycetes bacterium]|nr:homocysteine S-methyltransferase family protein [Planctomycetota bacterium]